MGGLLRKGTTRPHAATVPRLNATRCTPTHVCTRMRTRVHTTELRAVRLPLPITAAAPALGVPSGRRQGGVGFILEACKVLQVSRHPEGRDPEPDVPWRKVALATFTHTHTPRAQRQATACMHMALPAAAAAQRAGSACCAIGSGAQPCTAGILLLALCSRQEASATCAWRRIEAAVSGGGPAWLGAHPTRCVLGGAAGQRSSSRSAASASAPPPCIPSTATQAVHMS